MNHLVNILMTCIVLICAIRCRGELTEQPENPNKCDTEKEILTLRLKIQEQDTKIQGQDTKMANLENTILAQNINIQKLENMILSQKNNNLGLEKMVLSQNSDILARRIDQMLMEGKFNDSIQHLNGNQEKLVEEIQLLENESIQRIRNTTIQNGNKVNSILSNITTIQELTDSMYFKLSETRATVFDLNHYQDYVRKKLQTCLQKQSRMETNLQNVANDTAELMRQMETINDAKVPTIPTILVGKDCQDIRSRSALLPSGTYYLQVSGKCCVPVFCDMDTDGGGWTVFQHRFDGSVDFFRNWTAYKNGFGDVDGEHWLGNENIHKLTSLGRYKLRIHLEDFENNVRYAEYQDFSLGDEESDFTLYIGRKSGDAEDSLRYHNNTRFSTKDRDNDEASSTDCAMKYQGAWWYKNCYYSNLNGLYLSKKTDVNKYNIWYHWQGGRTNMKTTKMMIRKM